MAPVVLKPASTEELAEAILSTSRVRIQGSGSRLDWVRPWSGAVISTSGLSGIVDMRPSDGVVVVRAGTSVQDFLSEMALSGLGLPLALGWPHQISQRGGTIGGLVATGLPHAMESVLGPIKDWVLGVKVVRGDGSVAKAGSQVLKSVAGFDVQRFAVGSRGGLFALSEVILRLRRISAMPEPGTQRHLPATARYVARVLPDHIDAFRSVQNGVVAYDPCGLVWTSEPITADIGPGWWVGPHGTRSKVQAKSLELAAKEMIDPLGRFEGGWADV